MERRLLSPCCCRETLDVHQSPVATQLRGEIRQRLRAGESAAAIERELVHRHGARIQAVLAGSAGAWLLSLVLLSGGGLALLAWRISVRHRARAGDADSVADEGLEAMERSRYENELDDALQD